MVRHRTVRTKGALSPTTAKLMAFELVMAVVKTLAEPEGGQVAASVTVEGRIAVIDVPKDRAAGQN